MMWQPGGNTQIGTYLSSKILGPEVYSKINAKKLERLLLISIITDGMPSAEKGSELVNAILECAEKLQDAGFPRESACLMPNSSILVLSPSCKVHDWPDRNGT